jgi:iduronate 2-sulfatase
LDGASFAKVLDDPKTPTKDAILHAYARQQRIGRALRTERYRLVEWKVPGSSQDSAVYELYDYETDPGETKNLAKSMPEIMRKLTEILHKNPEAKPQLKTAAAAEAKEKAKPRNKRAKKRAA